MTPRFPSMFHTCFTNIFNYTPIHTKWKWERKWKNQTDKYKRSKNKWETSKEMLPLSLDVSGPLTVTLMRWLQIHTWVPHLLHFMLTPTYLRWFLSLLFEKEHWASHTKSECCTYYTTVLTYGEAGVMLGAAPSSPSALRGYTDHLAPLYIL